MRHLEAIIEANDEIELTGNPVRGSYTPGDKLGPNNGNGRLLAWEGELDRIRVRECIEASKGPMDHDVTLQDAPDMETGPGLEHVAPMRVTL